MFLKRKAVITCLAAAFLLTACSDRFSFAIDEQITDRFPSSTAAKDQVKARKMLAKPAPVTRKPDPFKVSGYADFQQGYDNNVNLDSKREKDGFSQITANANMSYKCTDSFKLKAGTDFFNILYYTHNENNILDLAPYAGFELKPRKDLEWRSAVTYDHFSYPNIKTSSYEGITLETYLRNYLVKRIYHEVGYEWLYRWYVWRKVTLATGQKGNDDREDARYRVKYNIGGYFRRFSFKIGNELSDNDSNVRYQDYYDYWTYRLSPSIMFFFTDRFYTNQSLIYKYMYFKDRRSTEDLSRKVHDNTFIYNSTFYYDITRNVSLGVTYSYTENVSNDPFQKYSDSTVTGGLFCSF